jgi:hypothetical protein
VKYLTPSSQITDRKSSSWLGRSFKRHVGHGSATTISYNAMMGVNIKLNVINLLMLDLKVYGGLGIGLPFEVRSIAYL